MAHASLSFAQERRRKKIDVPQARAYQDWIRDLERDRQRVESAHHSARRCVEQSQKNVARLEEKTRDFRQPYHRDTKKSSRHQAPLESYQKELERAKTRLRECQFEVSTAWNPWGIANRSLARVKARFDALGPAPAVSREEDALLSALTEVAGPKPKWSRIPPSFPRPPKGRR